MTKKPFKPTQSEAALIEWLLEAPEKRFAIHYRNSGGIHLCERATMREDGKWEFRRISGADPASPDKPVVDRFGGKLKLDPHNLRMAGLVIVAAAATTWPDEKERFAQLTSDLYRPTAWQYDCAIVVPSTTAKDWWEAKGSVALEKFVAKREEKKRAAAALERVGVFAVRREYGIAPYKGMRIDLEGRLAEATQTALAVVPRWAGVRPAFSAVIVRETETRYYIRDIVQLTTANLKIDGGMGSNTERYIDKSFLLLDHATEAEIAKLKAFDDEIVADYEAMRDKLVNELVPGILNAMDHKAQKAAEIDGTFHDMMAALRPDKAVD